MLAVQYTKTYRYAFNGKEKDDEVKGSGNSYDFGNRMYDSRLGRWLSLDPLQIKFPQFSPYNFVDNAPITHIDPEGNDVRISLFTRIFRPKVYQAFMNVIKTEEGQRLLSPFVTARQAKKFFGTSEAGKFADNVNIVFKAKTNEDTKELKGLTVPTVNNSIIVKAETAKQEFKDDTKVRIDIFVNPAEFEKGDKNVGGYTETAAHEFGIHAAPAIKAVLDIIFNATLSTEQKQEQLKERQSSGDPDTGLPAGLQHDNYDSGNMSKTTENLFKQSYDNLKTDKEKQSFKNQEKLEKPQEPK